jgi:XapX domain-containing protein
LVAGLFWKRASNLGAACAIFFGLATWIILEITDLDIPVPPQFFGLFASLFGMVLGSYITPNKHHLRA